MKTRFLIVFVLITGLPMLLASGCIQLEPTRLIMPEKSLSSEEAGLDPIPLKPSADDILVDLHNVLAMSAAQQKKEFEQAQKDFLSSGSAEDRLRLICLSLLPGRSLSDRSKAGRLLDEYLADPGRELGGLEGLASLLKMQFNETRALQKQVSAEKDRGDALANQLNEQKTQLEDIKSQMEALKKIEKIISDREKSGSPEK